MIAGFGAGILVAIVLGVIKGMKQNESAVIRDQRSALEKYFDNPQTLAEIRNNRDEIRRLYDRVDALRETVLSVANTVRDSINDEVRGGRHSMNNELQKLTECVEDEGSKGRELLRRQYELDQTAARMMENNLVAIIIGKYDELSKKIDHQSSQLAEFLARRRS